MGTCGYRLVADGTGNRYDGASGGVVGSWVVVESGNADDCLEGARSTVAGHLRSGMEGAVDSAGFVPEEGIGVEMAAEAVLGAACRRCRRSILRLPFGSASIVWCGCTVVGWWINWSCLRRRSNCL